MEHWAKKYREMAAVIGFVFIAFLHMQLQTNRHAYRELLAELEKTNGTWESLEYVSSNVERKGSDNDLRFVANRLTHTANLTRKTGLVYRNQIEKMSLLDKAIWGVANWVKQPIQMANILSQSSTMDSELGLIASKLQSLHRRYGGWDFSPLVTGLVGAFIAFGGCLVFEKLNVQISAQPLGATDSKRTSSSNSGFR